MPPCNFAISEKPDVAGNTTNDTPTKLQLSDIRRAIPDAAFKKSIWKAYGYMLFDYSTWFGTVFLMNKFCSSTVWSSMPYWQQIIASIVYFNVAGFFMWCLFMIGHDCGHGVFSNSTLENDLIGHLTHSSLLVPYYPWQLSHRRHHMYHNHMDKDYSYPWLTKEKFEHEDAYLARMLHSNPFFTFLFPFYAWPMYILFGQADGNHFIPFPSGRLWQNTPFVESVKCILSAIAVVMAIAVIYYIGGQNFSSVAYYYFGPWVIFGWWLVCVTYLQHHDPETLVYGESNWTFVDAAFETVDRQYGYLIDNLTHHITDGHVVHHLFFTKIPHYNLPMATEALQNYLKEKNIFHIYRFERTFDFAYRVHKYMVSNGFRAKEKKDAMIALDSKKSQ